MKLSELLRLLRSKGAKLEGHGKEHDVWSRNGNLVTRVPRHAKEIKTGTLKKILKDLGIKL